MADSTSVILPAAQAFIAGKLEMQESIAPGALRPELAWADYPANSVTVIVFTLVVLLTLRRLLDLLPLLLDSFSRWRGCMTIDSSVRLKSDRNLLGYISILPIALVADRYGIFTAAFLGYVPAEWHIFATLGMIIVWMLLRHFFYMLCSARTRRAETFRTAHTSLLNFLILMAGTMIITAGIISFTNISDSAGRMILIYEAGFFYLVGVIRERQILGSFCSQIQTFLYLCALEILPTGALVAGNILL